MNVTRRNMAWKRILQHVYGNG